MELAPTAKLDGALVYRPDEYSFDVVPAPPDAYTSFLLGDLNLEVTEAGKVVSVWGLCPHTQWVNAVLEAPKAESGNLFIDGDFPLERGVSQVLLRPQRISTFVDLKSGWIQIRAASNASLAIAVMSGIVFEIGTRGDFCSLWLHPRE